MEKNNPVIDQTLFDLKLNEAQFYSEQGLYDEADKIYINLINELKQLPATKSSAIQINQLESIRKEYQTETTKNKIIVKFSSDPEILNEQLKCEDFTDEDLHKNSYEDNQNDIDSDVAIFINDMIIEAFNRDVSDIYIEPSINSSHVSTNFICRDKQISKFSTDDPADFNFTQIRFRIDGICQPYIVIPNNFALRLIFKIKIMAKMDITMRGKPVYGKIKFKDKNTGTLELKAVVIPTLNSKEDIILKFVDSSKTVNLTQVGFPEYYIKSFIDVVNKPSGLIVLSGLSGSGKTTVLHSILKSLNQPGKKICSAEKSVQFVQKGICQTEIQPQKGLDYPEFVKAFMLSDSDIIMLGEIIDFDDTLRSYENISLVIKAALKKHLVLFEINALTILDVIKNILEIGVNPIHFANALLCIVNQKLVRKLCEKCRETYITPTDGETPDKTLDIVISKLWRGHDALNKEYESELIKHINKDKITIYNHSQDGCEECGYTGYRGRIAISEFIIRKNNDIKSLIKGEDQIKNISLIHNGEERDKSIKAHLYSNYNSYPLIFDGILKILYGITDIDEIKRNCL